MKVLLLSAEYQPISLISTKKATRLVVKGKVDVLKWSNHKIHQNFYAPDTIRLVKSISGNYRKEMRWSKSNVFVRDNFTCSYCGSKLTAKECTVDHILPVSKGGKNTWLNTTTACKQCNNYKGNKELHEISLTLKKKPYIPNLLNFINNHMKDVEINITDF